MVIVQKTFRQQVNNTLLTFDAGKVIEDENLEKVLLESDAPVEELVRRADLIHCPHCRKTFTVKQAVRAEPKRATAA